MRRPEPAIGEERPGHGESHHLAVVAHSRPPQGRNVEEARREHEERRRRINITNDGRVKIKHEDERVKFLDLDKSRNFEALSKIFLFWISVKIFQF